MRYFVTPSLIRQQHRLGCGVACLAMLTGQEYGAVYEALGSPDLTGEAGGITDCAIRDYLARFGLAFGGWFPEVVEVPCLVNVHIYPWSPCNHWALLLPSGAVLDPLSPYPWRLSDYDAVNSIVAIVPL